MQRASAFNTVIASAAAQKLNGRGEFPIWIDRKIYGAVKIAKRLAYSFLIVANCI